MFQDLKPTKMSIFLSIFTFSLKALRAASTSTAELREWSITKGSRSSDLSEGPTNL